MQQEFDYIVVGGGSAGCVVAARLAEEQEGSVLLLEAGDLAERNPDSLTADGFKYCFANDALMWDRMTVSQPECGDRPLYAGTGTGMGGSGSVNGMVYTRGDKADFAQWPAGWQWHDIAPSFEALEQRLDVRHREATAFTEKALDAAETIGLKRKHGTKDGELGGTMGYNLMNYRGDQRRSSYTAFIKANPQRNLSIETGVTVHQVLFEGKRACAIKLEQSGKFEIVKARREIVLCAGALETPKLLMLSGVGPANHLRELGIPVVLDAPTIGDNLHDHSNVTLFLQGKHPIDFGYPQVYGFDRMNTELELPEGQPDTCLALLSAPITVQQSMYRMVPAVLLPGKWFYNKALRFVIRKMIDLVFAIPAVKRTVANVYGIVVILGKPKSRGQLRLASANVKDQALIDPKYFADPADMQTLFKGVLAAKKMAAAEPLRHWGSKFLIPATRSYKESTLKKWIRSAAMTTFHFCGTCSMGIEESRPVSTDLKLKGVDGLRVADASVIPEIPVSALNAPSMMIGYRAVDFILAAASKGEFDNAATTKNTTTQEASS